MSCPPPARAKAAMCPVAVPRCHPDHCPYLAGFAKAGDEVAAVVGRYVRQQDQERVRLERAVAGRRLGAGNLRRG